MDEPVDDLDRVTVAQRVEEGLVLFAEDRHERTHRSGPGVRVDDLARVDHARHGEEPHVALQHHDLVVLDELVELVDDVEPQVAVRADGRRRHQAQLSAGELVALGPAGTGKTYLAISAAVEALEAGTVSRILLSRPAVEAGENLGFLPGDMREKLDPYLRPLWDALNDRLGAKRLRQNLDDGTIEIAPVAFMRGRTLNNSFVLIDEAQNCTYGQLKMLLTRLGWHSTMVMTGDPDQTDLLPELSGLGNIAQRLENFEDVAVVRLADKDVVRHPLVTRIVAAYDAHEPAGKVRRNKRE